jgi:hypothetical protein
MPHTTTPLDTRIYVNPTGERARLTVDRVSGPGGQRWWSVSLVRENGDVRPVAGQPPIQWHRTREQAREAYRERLAALRVEGWRRG